MTDKDTNDATEELTSLKSEEMENLNQEQVLTPEKPIAQNEPALADINWTMFDIQNTLGGGAFG